MPCRPVLTGTSGDLFLRVLWSEREDAIHGRQSDTSADRGYQGTLRWPDKGDLEEGLSSCGCPVLPLQVSHFLEPL